MKPNTTPTLPGRVDSTMLLKHLNDGEPVVIVKLIGVGNSAPYDFRDKGTRSYVFRWDNAYSGHTVRIPLSLWQANKGQMAHDIMDQRRMSHSMIVLIEMPAVIAKCEGPLTGENTLSPPQEVLESSETTAPANSSNSELLQTFTDFLRESDKKDGRSNIRPNLESRFLDHLEASRSSPNSENDSLEMVATDTPEARNVVGPSVEATVATAEEESTGIEFTERPGDSPLQQQAYDLVEPPKRIKALAALMGIEESLLRDFIALPDSKVELANAGWVRRKA